MLRRHFNFAYIGFSLVFVLGIITFVWPSVVRFVLTTADRVVLFAGLLTGGIVWWQGHLIRRQMELGAWLPDKPNPETVEDVLEFLEKISTFEKGRFISRGSIWDTFGWYLWRYYFYSKDVIAEMRREWTPKAPDRTLYKHLEDLCPKLLQMELAERNCYASSDVLLTEVDLLCELKDTKGKFIEAERRNISHPDPT